jgi:hypothetical protein
VLLVYFTQLLLLIASPKMSNTERSLKRSMMKAELKSLIRKRGISISSAKKLFKILKLRTLKDRLEFMNKPVKTNEIEGGTTE